MDAWNFFLENEDAIKKMCASLSGGDVWIEDDMYTEAALRVGRVWEMHTPNRLKILRIIRYYLWKYRNKYRKRTHLTFDGDLPSKEEPLKLDLEDEVSYVVDGLEDWQVRLLKWKAEGFTLQEMADCLGVSPCTVRNYLIEAKNKCLLTKEGFPEALGTLGTTQEDAKQD